MHLFAIRATVNGLRVPIFYVYGFDEDDARDDAKKILSAMLHATGSCFDPWGRTPGYFIEVDET